MCKRELMMRSNMLTFMCLMMIPVLGNAKGISENKRMQPNVIIIYTDDHGYSDIACQDVHNDLKTPNIDELAKTGVRVTSGYSTAPQCVPSRGGLISGQYQNRFGLESNGHAKHKVMKRFGGLESVPERLQKAGYATGMAGKWHLGPKKSDSISTHGFTHAFHKHSNAKGDWNMNLDGESIKGQVQDGKAYHLDIISDFACSFIKRYQDQPFFFYLAYRAPHVPLDAPQQYLDRFPGEMPQRRRQALAMLSAVDDGIGRIVATLEKYDIDDNTLIFIIGDNGAPLKIHKEDKPGGGPGWDGSLNDPMNGEKGMLTEGGIRVPFVVNWKGTIPGGQTYNYPLISLDAGATAVALAGLPTDSGLDGVNIVPYLKGELQGAPHDALYWRWLGQAAIRKGKWKYLKSGKREYLFDIDKDFSESTNIINQHPEIAKELHKELEAWSQDMIPAGLSDQLSKEFSTFYDYYFDGIIPQAHQ